MPSDRQRAGLALGPVARSRRAGLRAAIAAGAVDVAALFEGREIAAEEDAIGMRVDTLIAAAPGVGEETVAAVLRVADVEPHKRLGTLTIQRRNAIAAAFTEETTR